MSRAWPLFQVNLWGVFDRAGDLNDHLVIERGNRVLNGDGDKNDHPGGCGNEEGGGGRQKLESQRDGT